jgi:hypothetical protein
MSPLSLTQTKKKRPDELHGFRFSLANFQPVLPAKKYVRLSSRVWFST